MMSSCTSANAWSISNAAPASITAASSSLLPEARKPQKQKAGRSRFPPLITSERSESSGATRSELSAPHRSDSAVSNPSSRAYARGHREEAGRHRHGVTDHGDARS